MNDLFWLNPKGSIQNKLFGYLQSHFCDKFIIFHVKIELLLNFPCDSKDQLRAKEGEMIKLHDCVNKYRPFTTDGEKRKNIEMKILK